jgi:hypothetical protein
VIWTFAVIALELFLFGLILVQDELAIRRTRREAKVRSAISLYRIRRRLDVADLRVEQRQAIDRLRHEIGGGLDRHDEP